MKKFIVISIFAFALVGCTSSKVTPQPKSEAAVTTTLSGSITSNGGKYYIGGPGQPPKELDSYTIKLENYVGKTVKVTGQYSGTTLFVDTVQ